MSWALRKNRDAAAAITVNGRVFTPIKDADIAGPQQGFYKLDAHGVLLLNAEREPMAFVSTNSAEGFMVTAHRTGEGRVRYMFGLAESTIKWLGFDALNDRAEREVATSVLQQAGFENPSLVQWNVPKPDEEGPVGLRP